MQSIVSVNSSILPHSLENNLISEICCGPMKSGKSRHLIDRAEALFHQHRPFLAFKPRQDTRDGGFIKTREAGYRQVEAIMVESASEIRVFLEAARQGQESLLEQIALRQSLSIGQPEILALRHYIKPMNHQLEVCLVDEVFLLDSGILSVKEYLDQIGIALLASGLDRDFRGEYFPLSDYAQSGITMKEVIGGYKHSVFLAARCDVCGADAAYTQRLVNGEPAPYHSPTILIGDADYYEARCDRHHCVPGRPNEPLPITR